VLIELVDKLGENSIKHVFSIEWAIFVHFLIQFKCGAELGILDHQVFDAVLLVVIFIRSQE
jgi:hypothetical protein